MKYQRILFTIVLLSAALVLQACVAGMQLTPISADPAELKGTYNLILYGCRFAGDVENMAILVDEKSPYSLEVYALDAMYKVRNRVPASQALGEADTFIHCSMHTVWKTVLRRIVDRNDRTIGYELKPLYRPWEFAVAEALQSSYSLNNGKVTARMVLDPEVEKAVNASNGKGADHDSH